MSTDLTDRERFHLMLMTQSLRRADAIILLAGEDGEGRKDTALELLHQLAAPCIVCAGGRHEPPRITDGDTLAQQLVAAGVAPDRVMVDLSVHTQEQAQHIIELAAANDWKVLLIVASAYHLPRAYLTFVQAILTTDPSPLIRLVPVPSRHLPWFGALPGTTDTRADQLDLEAAKCAEYTEHVASYVAGIAYLKYWEQSA